MVIEQKVLNYVDLMGIAKNSIFNIPVGTERSIGPKKKMIFQSKYIFLHYVFFNDNPQTCFLFCFLFRLPAHGFQTTQQGGLFRESFIRSKIVRKSKMCF